MWLLARKMKQRLIEGDFMRAFFPVISECLVNVQKFGRYYVN